MIKNTFDLLMVSQYTDNYTYNGELFSYGSSTESVNIGDRSQENQLGNGRTALNFSKGNYYIVIIGPDNKKVEDLAKIVAGKIN